MEDYKFMKFEKEQIKIGELLEQTILELNEKFYFYEMEGISLVKINVNDEFLGKVLDYYNEYYYELIFEELSDDKIEDIIFDMDIRFLDKKRKQKEKNERK